MAKNDTIIDGARLGYAQDVMKGDTSDGSGAMLCSLGVGLLVGINIPGFVEEDLETLRWISSVRRKVRWLCERRSGDHVGGW